MPPCPHFLHTQWRSFLGFYTDAVLAPMEGKLAAVMSMIRVTTFSEGIQAVTASLTECVCPGGSMRMRCGRDYFVGCSCRAMWLRQVWNMVLLSTCPQRLRDTTMRLS